MQNFEGFSLRELEGVGVVCSKCGTEAMYRVNEGPDASANQNCPECNDRNFIQLFNPSGRNPLTIVGALQSMVPISTQSEIRLYFMPRPE